MIDTAGRSPFFTISLDFELFWGMYDVTTVRAYGAHILGVRGAIPEMLRLFREYDVASTWATVGFVTFDNKRELMANLPDVRPEYLDATKDPYTHLHTIGDSESSDPLHYGRSLVRKILESPGTELASHTFSHLCALGPRKNRDAFRADLAASVAANERAGARRPTSLVFPRNQFDRFHLGEAAAAGFGAFRGNERHRWYEADSSACAPATMRAGRLIDSYVSLTGSHSIRVSSDESGLVNIPSSRFLRPCSPGIALLERLRLHRILSSMRTAARAGAGYHLWWHPHNFGVNVTENIAFLKKILDHYRHLRDEFGMRSLTMGELSQGGR